MLKPLFLILGPHKAGKDTIAEYFRDVWNFQYKYSTSWPLVKLLHREACSPYESREYPELGIPGDAENYPSIELLFENRHKYSETLYKLGKLMRARHGDLTLVDKLLDDYQQDIVVGLRERVEMQKALEKYDFQVFWVHRSGLEKDPTLEFSLEDVLDACGKNKRKFMLIDNSQSIGKTIVGIHGYFKSIFQGE